MDVSDPHWLAQTAMPKHTEIRLKKALFRASKLQANTDPTPAYHSSLVKDGPFALQ